MLIRPLTHPLGNPERIAIFQPRVVPQRGATLGTSKQINIPVRDELRDHARQNSRAEEQAERIVTAELRKLRWNEGDLAKHRKGDPRKVAIARRLRRDTTMTLKWIAHRLKMGTWTHVANRLYHLKN